MSKNKDNVADKLLTEQLKEDEAARDKKARRQGKARSNGLRQHRKGKNKEPKKGK